MVKQMVTEHNPQVNNQADAQKTANEGFHEKGQAGSEALSFTIDRKEIDLSGYTFGIYYHPVVYRLPEVSGFSMSRKV